MQKQNITISGVNRKYTSSLKKMYDELTGLNLRVVTITGKESSKDRHLAKNMFQSGDADVILLTIGAGSVGLTLTRSSTCIFAGLDWTPANMLQAENRVHRIGSNRPVTIYYIGSNSKSDKLVQKHVVTKLHLSGMLMRDPEYNELIKEWINGY